MPNTGHVPGGVGRLTPGNFLVVQNILESAGAPEGPVGVFAIMENYGHPTLIPSHIHFQPVVPIPTAHVRNPTVV